jgi:hypothetical protein
VWATEPGWTTWKKLLTISGIELRPFGCPVRSQAPYWLHCPTQEKNKTEKRRGKEGEEMKWNEDEVQRGRKID